MGRTKEQQQVCQPGSQKQKNNTMQDFNMVPKNKTIKQARIPMWFLKTKGQYHEGFQLIPSKK